MNCQIDKSFSFYAIPTHQCEIVLPASFRNAPKEHHRNSKPSVYNVASAYLNAVHRTFATSPGACEDTFNLTNALIILKNSLTHLDTNHHFVLMIITHECSFFPFHSIHEKFFGKKMSIAQFYSNIFGLRHYRVPKRLKHLLCGSKYAMIASEN